ncbi:MAG TPA: division/cell wall cluster transcriptional repressor MraZ [Bacteroidales bacterium]
MIELIGVQECKVDAKGRLLFPVAIKNQLKAILDEGFVIKRSIFHKCLELYPRSEWNNEVRGVNKLNRFVKKNNDFIRVFMAGVREVELDTTGRLLIPKDLVNFGEIKSEVVLSSSLNRIEIWDKDKYEASISASMEDFSTLAEEVMGNFKIEE